MADDDLEEALQPPPPLLDHAVVEAVQVDLARQRRDADARRLALQEVTEDFEVGVAPADLRAAEFEGWDVGR